MENRSIREWQVQYARGEFNKGDYETMCAAGWVDWFCKDETLKSRLDKMAKIVMKLNMSDKIDIDKMGVYFKNNCPLAYPTYDDFRLYYLNGSGNEYVIEMMSEYTKQRFNANYVVFHKSNWSKPIFKCRTSRELVNWLNDCSSCEI